MSQMKTGNCATIPVISERDKKLLAVIGKASSEGLGLPEGSIGISGEDTPENPPMNEEHSMESEYIYISVNNTENTHSESETTNVCSTPKAPQKEPKVLKEHKLFKNLIKVNNDGLLSIANALESVAVSNNNIAASLERINGTLNAIYST